MLPGDRFHNPESVTFVQRVDTGYAVTAASQQLQLCQRLQWKCLATALWDHQRLATLTAHIHCSEVCETEANRLKALKIASGHTEASEA